MTTPIRPRICLWFALTVLRVFGVFGGVLHAEVTAATEGVQGVQGVQGVPRFNSARYEDLWTRSPFGIETAPIMVIKQGPFFCREPRHLRDRARGWKRVRDFGEPRKQESSFGRPKVVVPTMSWSP